MAKSFAAQVDAWAKQSEARLIAIAKTASQSVVEEIIDGTPVDIGFLRGSFTVATGNVSMIVTDDRPPKDAGKNSIPAQPYALTINGLKAGQTLTGYFTANYGVYVEYGANGKAAKRMVGRAAQKWDIFVKDATRIAKAIVR